MATVRLRVANRHATAQTLVIEPWADELTLAPGQTVTITSEGELSSALEIEVEPGRLTFYAFDSAGAMARVHDSEGKQLF